jgi:NAD(P)-dependent dehydrogenase (short-subunit alcohol dehydrogenase family)
VIATDLVRKMAQATYDGVVAKVPLERPWRPEEAAAMIAWFASSECPLSAGATFDLSGGRAAC